MAIVTTISLALAMAAGGVPPGGGAAMHASGMVLLAARDDERPSRSERLRDRALDAIKQHKFAEAEQLIHEGRKTRSSSRKDQWQLIEARLELERENYPKAGLLAMQIVILREKSDEVAAALYWTARAYEGMGRPNKAVQLYEECRLHKTAPESLVRVASRRIEQLRETPSEEK